MTLRNADKLQGKESKEGREGKIGGFIDVWEYQLNIINHFQAWSAWRCTQPHS